jgi:hypothetical protein
MGDVFWLGTVSPSSYYVMLVTDIASTLTTCTNAASELSEIPSGNGYNSPGASIFRSASDMDVSTEDDGSNIWQFQLADVAWTATGGNIPASGNGANAAVLVTASGGLRDVMCWWDLVSNRTVSDGQTLTLQDCELQITE